MATTEKEASADNCNDTTTTKGEKAANATDELAAALQENLQIKDDDKNKEASKADKDETETTTTTTKEQLHAWRKEAPPELVKVADWIQTGKMKRILALTGAGLSVAAGIPDFRTPGTGLYDNLQKYNLPFPEAVFDLSFYRKNPQPFTQLAQELWPGLQFVPTLAHSFLTLLHRKGLLLRCYTQNIDGLEHVAKLPANALVECHGHFRTASCTNCGAAADGQAVKASMVERGEAPKCSQCNGYVKPDIVFFGEGLPNRFHNLLRQDVPAADACLILGTSLAVMPVGGIPSMVGRQCKRVLLNRELVGDLSPKRAPARDVFFGGDCDVAVEWLAKLCGWWPELQSMHAALHAEIKGTAGGGGSASTTATPSNPKPASSSSSMHSSASASPSSKKKKGKSSCVVG